ncbi:uncharacterized protein BXZ73DRAFT_51265 [Epithele typhae]|uniref:uncharacterized protein n=1 Tax=Epithele typhae TaxID=378194 RepID=UPI002007641C|nr:uncharacterized protein BXZ73DRAFT_51265 [Epithele typhae]KAH9922868.1 hypothetical protein BXZ73DRAFT_51265 [Epithele typhae]
MLSWGRTPSAEATGSQARTPRTLVLCFDGTSNQFDGENTNVVKFYSLLKKDDSTQQQLCYYQPGVGTYFNPGVVSPLFQWCAKILDEAFAWYLDEHVRQGYQFLMQNWTPGDKICIFGFSRGAYTARALAGILHKIGLLPKDNLEQIPFAYNLYKKTDEASISLAAGFKQSFCREVQIEFVGVWETVSSTGVIMSRTLPFTTTNATIKTFRQALSLDEHRVKFLPNLYHRTATPSDGPTSSIKPKALRQKSLNAFVGKFPKAARKNATTTEKPKVRAEPVDLEAAAAAAPPSHTSAEDASAEAADVVGPAPRDVADAGACDVLEVWFAGCHSDVGGGSVSSDTVHSLANIPLFWMVHQVVLAQCGIEFDSAALARVGIPEAVLAPPGSTVVPAPRRTRLDSEAPTLPVKDRDAAGNSTGPMADALQPIFDQLQIDKAWWLLEAIPLTYSAQDADGTWVTKWWFPGHYGQGRQLPAAPKFHVSVKTRMEDPTLEYVPRAVWTAGTETYVE